MGAIETTLVILKPDAVQRGLIGEIIGRFERKGLQIVGLKMAHLSRTVAEQHYEEHRQRGDFAALVTFVSSGPVVIIALRGKNAISACRKLIGSSVESIAEPGTIRGDYSMSCMHNLVHGADAVSSAERELKAFFADAELFAYSSALKSWTYAELDGI